MTPSSHVDLPNASSVFVRLLLIVGNTIALHVSITKPNPPPSQNDRVKVSGLEDTSKNLLRPLMNCFSLAPGIIELAAMLIRLVGPPTSDIISGTCAERISFNVLAVLAFLLSLCGMGIRLWCYRTLGKFFTFELALLPDHKLVTSGPYAFVRHPSYTGGLLALVGMTLANISKGSWAYECGIMSSWRGIGWGTVAGISVILVLDRCTREDKILQEAFKEEWDVWSARVSWRLVPLVY